MKNIKWIALCLALAAFTACKKDGFGGLTNAQPDVPVTVSNIYGIYTYPVIFTSLSGGGAISITLNIPASTGRKIKEITRVAAGTSGTNYKSVEVTTGLYNTAPIAGSGTSVTFNTSLAEYTSKTGLAAPSAAAAGSTTSFLARYFFFMITLDNGQVLIPEPVRVYVGP
jgi:hypothetical protein